MQSSFDLERESNDANENEEEEGKEHNSNKQMNTSFHTQQPHSMSNKIHPVKKTLFHEQFSASDLFAPDKKLGISEKKLFVRTLVMNSSLNTSFNLNKVKTVQMADINFELVIEGECLTHMFKDHRKLLGKIIKHMAVVLVCRSSPKQKAEVIEFAKEINPQMVSLAIGDGGNDVSMIKTADVGIGIFGKEGYQAVTASDYAIGEFQFLKRLMFIHGRFNVRRISIFITQFLVKNLVFSISQL